VTAEKVEFSESVEVAVADIHRASIQIASSAEVAGVGCLGKLGKLKTQ
jgi:hypothetical protein